MSWNLRGYWLSALVAALALQLPLPAAGADWPTYRGNAARTGSLDNLPGPKAPQALWVHKSQEHFVASPMIADKLLVISGLGAFNTSALRAMSLDPAAAKREAWNKSTPYLKLPTVSSPATLGNMLVFGDGMHQTEGSVLHCVRADTGLPLWQLPVHGKLVHLEGAPTIAEGRVLIGAGSGGVLAVDLNKVTLDGAEQDLAQVQETLAKKWQALLAAYEDDKKKDPDFAVPPSEDALPKARPKVAWQVGQDKWHVDAPVAVVGQRVFVGSAFLDEEKLGERALLCLNLADGKPQWTVPLKFNPWSGASVLGELAVVGTSSIRYDTKLIPVGKGEVVAVNANSGDVKWRRSVAGGVISSVALDAGEKLAVFTATDGKLRGWSLEDGLDKWTYDAAAPFFAAPAIAGGIAYAADLKGIVHAVRLADGQSVWKFDLSQAAQAPGMVYGAPILAGGRIYVATCNLEGTSARQPTAVVCLGDK